MTRYFIAAALAALTLPAPAPAAPANAVAAPTRLSVEVVGSGPDVILIDTFLK